MADGEVLSHAELARRVADRAAAWGPARRLVLVEGADDLDSLVAYLAALQHGHVALVVPDARAAQRDAVVAAYDPDIVCVHGERDDVRRSESAHDLHPDLALLLSTSGTTGSPKLVRLSRDNVAANAAAIADYLALTPADRAITALPLHYCYGLSVLHSHLVAGASVVLTVAQRGRRVLLGPLRPHRRDHAGRRAAHLRPAGRQRLRGPRRCRPCAR